jgi:hypothetical protein
VYSDRQRRGRERKGIGVAFVFARGVAGIRPECGLYVSSTELRRSGKRIAQRARVCLCGFFYFTFQHVKEKGDAAIYKCAVSLPVNPSASRVGREIALEINRHYDETAARRICSNSSHPGKSNILGSSFQHSCLAAACRALASVVQGSHNPIPARAAQNGPRQISRGQFMYVHI